MTGWAGWSTRWYREPFYDDAMMSAVGLSLTYCCLRRDGGGAAIRHHCRSGDGGFAASGRFKRFLLFMITAPLVMPGCDYRPVAAAAVCRAGASDYWLAVGSRHADYLAGARDLLVLRNVAVVISSRHLRELDHSYKEAAMDWALRR